MAAWKILPAIAAGNTIVLKPAELTPLTSLLFAQAATEAGIPDGVINIVTGDRQGRRRAPRRPPRRRHDLLHRLHRRRQAGRRDRHRHRQAAAPGARRQGARSSSSTTPTWRPPRTARSPARSSTPARTARPPPAPTCSGRSTTRSSRGVADLMETVRLGDPFAPAHRPRPADLARPARPGRRLRRPGRAPTPRVVTGGEVPGGELARRRLLPADPGRRRRPGQRDRPVGDLRPGAGGAALRQPTTRASRSPTTPRTAWPPPPGAGTCTGRTAPPARSRPGCVWVNDHIPIISEMPHGGYKASGFGKDMSAYSFEEYTQVKHVMYDNTAVAREGLAPHRSSGTDSQRHRPPDRRPIHPERAPRAWSSTSPTASPRPQAGRHAAQPHQRQGRPHPPFAAARLGAAARSRSAASAR